VLRTLNLRVLNCAWFQTLIEICGQVPGVNPEGGSLAGWDGVRPAGAAWRAGTAGLRSGGRVGSGYGADWVSAGGLWAGLGLGWIGIYQIYIDFENI